MQVTFVLASAEPAEELATLDPDRDWREFTTGEYNWILQPYLRLRASGYPVTFAADLPEQGIAVFSSKQRRLLAARHARTQLTLVGTRQDLGEALIADFEVVQNRHSASGARRYFIPHFPQPALIARDPARGDRIETLAYKGLSGNLHPEFHDSAWREFLAARGLRWVTDAVQESQSSDDKNKLAWNDYREVDLVLAARPRSRNALGRSDLHPRKPATKLYNAWRAGVPALLGPELAYRELRESPLDYLEIANRLEAQTAVQRLLDGRALYRSMIEQGNARAPGFSVEEITRQWATLLFETLPSLLDARHVRRWRGRSLRLKQTSRRLARAVGIAG